MSKAFVGSLIATAAFTCCTKSSEEGGRAGNDTFRIVVPAMAAGVKQGEVQTVRVVLERGKGFKQRVKLEVKAPVGVQVEPKEAMIQPGDKGDVQLKITVAKDAPVDPTLPSCTSGCRVSLAGCRRQGGRRRQGQTKTGP